MLFSRNFPPLTLTLVNCLAMRTLNSFEALSGRRLFTFALPFLIGLILLNLYPTPSEAQIVSGWRFHGPGVTGGRIRDIKVVPGNPDQIYVAAATGGVFKSTDDTRSWAPIFDGSGSTSLSIGDMAIDPHHPEVIWVGTGEASGEQSAASVGDGIYKSTDGGTTWQCMGLRNVRHIARIQVSQADPDVVFVAATGARWGDCEERGLYRTRDGGKTWEKILYINELTGFSDVAVTPDGQTVFASAWHQYRNAWAHLQRGPHSALYRSVDGGNTWEKVTKGFAEENMGRIALAIAPNNPRKVYACVESEKGGFYRSTNGGKSWKLMNTKASTSYWYGKLYVHPNNDDQVFVMGVMVLQTTDGGKTFNLMPTRNVHVDHHALWIDPRNPGRRLLGNDGGLYQTADGGTSWTFISNLKIGQYYAISIDNRKPYWIYGGLQDNGVWGGPSQLAGGGEPADSDVISVCGGDGFWSATDPIDSCIAYGESQYGWIVWYDHRTSRRHRIQPRNPDPENPYRFNWNAPFIISTHPPYPLYLGGNKLLRSDDRRGNWQEVSPDLSRNRDLNNRTIQGLKPVIKPYASITALAESPIKPGIIYTGTDDGNLFMTPDGGTTWVDLSGGLPVPKNRFWTRLVCSRHDEGTVYAACARYYEANDFTPYLFRSTDFGKSWEVITHGMPAEAVVRGFAEHPLHPNLLFCGIHNGLLISDDTGKSWHRAPDLIPVAIDDIRIAMPDHELVLGSYGRGLIIGKLNPSLLEQSGE